MVMGQIRQGDVLLVPAEVQPPSDARVQAEVILAKGEMTGHAHRLQATEVLEWEAEGQRYVRVGGQELGTLTHEDHDPVGAAVVMPQTTYRVVQQKEYSLAEEWERVKD